MVAGRRSQSMAFGRVAAFCSIVMRSVAVLIMCPLIGAARCGMPTTVHHDWKLYKHLL